MLSTHDIQPFQDYLEKYHTPQTVSTYTYVVNTFLAEFPKADTAGYKDILPYIGKKMKDKKRTKTWVMWLAAIKRYYDYLIEQGSREDHPCRSLYLKNTHRTNVLQSDLFTLAELEQLQNREERYGDLLRNKHQLIFSFLIRQALAPSEIAQLTVNHINLDEGNIFVKASKQRTQRWLELHPTQFRLLDRYVHQARPKLVREDKPKHNALILSKLGTPVSVDSINYLIETAKPLFPERNLNASTIRQSIVSHWLNVLKIPPEDVQLLAGHRWLSSTLRYVQTPIEEQRAIINQFHPLG